MSESKMPGVAVVGCGYWGQNLVRNFAELGALVAVCDADRARMAKFELTYPAVRAMNFEEVLSSQEVQAVVIAAPAAQHFELAKRALLAGKDVFVEKPLALHVTEGEELVELAQRCSRILMVGHLLHYHPAIVELRRLLQAGELGRVEYISSSRLNLGKLRTEEDILWSFAPHDISAILHLLDEAPTRVVAQGASYLNHPISDVTLTILSFASGVKAHIFVSWLHPFKEQKLVLVGDRKMAVFDDTQSDQKLVLYPHRIDWINRVPVARKAEGEVVPLSKEEPLRRECLHFLECVREHRTPDTDGENGLRVLKILHAAGRSIRENGHPVSLGQEEKLRYRVNPSAIVDQPSEIGEGTAIGHFSHVMSDSRIGGHCTLGHNVHVASGVRIGNNVKIQNNVSLCAGVELGDDILCGPSVVFTDVIAPRSHVSPSSENSRTLVRRGATLGANSTIVCGVTIGEYAYVGAGTTVMQDVPDHACVVGDPARQFGWICQCGVRLEAGENFWGCPSCGSKYLHSEGRLVRALDPSMERQGTSAGMAAAAGQN